MWLEKIQLLFLSKLQKKSLYPILDRGVFSANYLLGAKEATIESTNGRFISTKPYIFIASITA